MHMAFGSQARAKPQEAGASESHDHLSERLGEPWTPLRSWFLLPRVPNPTAIRALHADFTHLPTAVPRGDGQSQPC